MVVVFVAWFKSVGRAPCFENAHILTLAVREVRDPEATAEFVDMVVVADWTVPVEESAIVEVPAVTI